MRHDAPPCATKKGHHRCIGRCTNYLCSTIDAVGYASEKPEEGARAGVAPFFRLVCSSFAMPRREGSPALFLTWATHDHAEASESRRSS